MTGVTENVSVAAPAQQDTVWNRVRSLGHGWIWQFFPWFFVIAGALSTIAPVGENDLFFHIDMGNDIRDFGRFSGNPDWTFAPSDPNWANTMVFPEIVFSYWHDWFGWTGFAVLRTIATVAFAVSLWVSLAAVTPSKISSKSPGPARAAALITLLVISASVSSLTIRPQTFTYVFFPIVGVWIARILREGRMPNPIFVGVVTLAWAWTHGSSLLVAPVLAIAIALRFAAFRPTKSLLLRSLTVIVTAFIAPLLTPAGIGIWQSAKNLHEIGNAYITEWSPLDFKTASTWALVFLLGTWIWVTFKRERRDITWARQTIIESVFLAVVTVASVNTARTSQVFAPLIAVLLMSRLAPTLANVRIYSWERISIPERNERAIKLASTGVLLVAIAVTGFFGKLGGVYVPSTIWDKLHSTPGPHRVLVSWNVSSQPAFFGPPGTRVFMNSPADKFGREQFEKLLLFTLTPDKELGLPDEYDVTDIVIEKEAEKVPTLLRNGWTIVEEDNEFVLLRRAP